MPARAPSIARLSHPPCAWVMPLGEVRRDDAALVGSKAANLGELRAAGWPVPDGYCVTTAAYRLWLESPPLGHAFRRSLERMAAAEPAQLPELARLARETLSSAPLPAAVVEAIRCVCAAHAETSCWAVRSSATVEDRPGTSAAGQHDTLLNVPGVHGVLEAVRQCWISLFTDRAVLYRHRHRHPQHDAAMGVVVQAMVPAERSGVLFTQDPATGDAGRLVIESVYGLGELLVAGKVSPDRIVLEKRTLAVVERGVGCQPIEARPAPGGGVHEQAIDPVRRARASLEDPMARELAVLGLAVERAFQGPQDIEWAAVGERLFLLQARPVTAQPAVVGRGVARPEPAQDPDAEIWTNANIMEALPEVVMPLSWSLAEVLLRQFLDPLLGRLGLDTGRPLVTLIAGRAYLNIRRAVELVARIAGPIPVDLTTAFGGLHDEVAARLRAEAARARRRWDLRAAVRLLPLGAWLLPGLVNQGRLLRDWGAPVFAGQAALAPERMTDAQLADHPLALLHSLTANVSLRTWAAAVWMGLAAVGASTAVFHLARRWLDDADGSIANRLLAGADGMNSAENGLALVRVAAWARRQPELRRALLDARSFAEIESRLRELPGGPEFLDRWRHFMSNHGHQARGGMDIAQPRWSELPDFVLEMLQVYLRFPEGEDPLAARERHRRDRAALLAECRRRLHHPLKFRLIAFLVRAAQRGLLQRENMKNDGVRMVAVLRSAAFEVGRRLTDRGVLRDRDEVFFLRFDEFRPLLCETPAPAVAEIIRARRADHARWRALQPPPVIVGSWQPEAAPADVAPGNVRTLRGVAVSPGVVTGKARVILHADAAERVLPGEILIAPYTDPGWTPYFLAAAGLVVDVGGQLSHGSVVAREYGLPAVVNVGPATRLITTGQSVRVDGHRGLVSLLD